MRARPYAVQPGNQLPRKSSTYPLGNPYTPPIPQPAENIPNLAACVTALKACVESLIGQRGDASNRAVTFNDLIAFGLLEPQAVSSPIGGEDLGNDGTITGVFGGVGLSGEATTGSVTLDLEVPVLVSYGGTGAITAPAALVSLGAAPINSPAFTGDPRAPTPITADNDTSVATTAFVKAQGYATGNQTITLSGDLTGSGTTSIDAQIAANAVGTPEIANSNVTYGKIQNTSAARLLGNPTGSAAPPSEISLGSGLSFTGSVLDASGAGSGITEADADLRYVNVVGDTMSGGLYVPLVRTGVPGAGGVGAIGFTFGTTALPGYIEWFLPDGTRQAYLGANSSCLFLRLEEGGNLRVSGPGNAGIELDNATLTANLTMFNNGVGHIISTTGLYLNWIGNQPITAAGSLDIYGTNKLNIHSTLFAEADGAGVGYNKLYSAAGNVAQYIGAGDTETTYYRQNSHKFQNIAGDFEIAMLNTTATYNQSGAWVVFSDAELKEDIQPFERSLDAVAALRPVSFRYRKGMPFADPAGGAPLLGLLAHEVEEHIPEIVGEAPVYRRGKVKTLAPGNLVYPMINALREIKRRLEALEARLG